MGTGELLGKPDEMLVGGGKPCDGLASHPGGSCNYPSCFLLRKQGPVPARGGGGTTRLKYRLFFATNNSTSDLTGYFKTFLKFCGMLEANLVGKNMETCLHHGHGNLFLFSEE